MSSYKEHNPHKSSTSTELNEWTVLVRVGENEWRIGRNASESQTDELGPRSDSSRIYDWQEEAAQYRRRARRPQVYEQLFQTKLGRFLYQQYVQWRQVLLETLTPILSGKTKRGGEEPYAGQDFPRRSQDSRIQGNLSKAEIHSSEAQRLRRRRFRDSLQLGAIVGLVLGCFSLVIFHQISPVKSIPTKVIGQSQLLGTTTTSSHYVTIPALRVYTVQVGPFPSQGDANRQSQTLHSKGIWTAVTHVNRGYMLVAGAAFDAGPLQSLEMKLKKQGYTPSINLTQQPVTRLHAASGASVADTRKITTWLTAATSSLNTLTGVVEENEAMRDAQAAYMAANALVPSKAILQESGYAHQLSAFEEDWQAAYSALVHKDSNAAAQNCVLAYLDLTRLHQGG